MPVEANSLNTMHTGSLVYTSPLAVTATVISVCVCVYVCIFNATYIGMYVRLHLAECDTPVHQRKRLWLRAVGGGDRLQTRQPEVRPKTELEEDSGGH